MSAPDENPIAGVGENTTISYMFRNMQPHLVALSSQADLKANVVITASAVLMTLSAAHFGDHDLRVAAVVLAAGCAVSLVFAVLAVVPEAALRHHEGKTINPLFFGDAAKMPLADFEALLGSAVRDEAEVYRMQARDLHEFSSYLAKSKFRRLRRAYLTLLGTVLLAAFVQVVLTIVG